MTQKLIKTALLLGTLLPILAIASCKDDDEPVIFGDVISESGTVVETSSSKGGEDEPDALGANSRYIGSTHNVVDYYFSPKKLNICALQKYKYIYVDWLGADTESLTYTQDSNQAYSTRYCFISKENVAKYSDAAHVSDGHYDVMIDDADILSPYKEYAAFYGDTICVSKHSNCGINQSLGACVLPLIGIDVVCSQDFDAAHPAGTSLNDVVVIAGMNNTYNCLHEKDENGKLLYSDKSSWEMFDAENYILENIPLTTIPNNPILMMQSQFGLGFTSEPSSPGIYDFTVKFTFGADPLTGETVDIAPATVSIDF